jgi:hypothetical protein
MKSVHYDTLLHDENSKVWLINNVIVDGVDVSPTNKMSKDLMIFYESREVTIVPLKDMGKVVPKRGVYSLNSDDRMIDLDFIESKESWQFDLTYITEDSILMVPRKGREPEFKIRLVPFPKL